MNQLPTSETPFTQNPTLGNQAQVRELKRKDKERWCKDLGINSSYVVISELAKKWRRRRKLGEAKVGSEECVR